jgi:dihydropteroate synthase
MKPDLKETSLNFLSINIRGKLFVTDWPEVMGIINLTPDSFYSPSRAKDLAAVLNQAERMLKEGAFCLDLGAYSSRPGAPPVGEKEELERLIPAVEKISACFPEAVISVDTFRGTVAKAAVEAGAHLLNDISAGKDPLLLETAARYSCPYIAMHMQGSPATMQLNPVYENVTQDLLCFFIEKMALFRQHGIKDIILDPGFGFGKSMEHNYTLLRELKAFQVFGVPVLAGVSRKSMITRLLNISSDEALNGTTAVHLLALAGGAAFLRAHDVKEAVQCVKIYTTFAGK